MKKRETDIWLLIAFVVLVAGTIITITLLMGKQPVKGVKKMTEAVELTKEWFTVIDNMKREKGITSDAHSNVPYNCLIGNEWSEITTSLGSLEAKETATNPDFAALIVKLLQEAGIEKGERVGVILSGSFPSLAISALAALQTLEIDAMVMSSIGSSTYGANQPGATWIDMESRLIREGGMKFSSALVSSGAEGDAGLGVMEEGIEEIEAAATRNGVSLFVPASLEESIIKRVEMFREAEIRLLINIGGNQAALGACPHASVIPNGMHFKIEGCSDMGRGVITRLNEEGIPIIHLLNIKDLASRYGIAVSPGIRYPASTALFTNSRPKKGALMLLLIAELVPVWFLRKRIISPKNE